MMTDGKKTDKPKLSRSLKFVLTLAGALAVLCAAFFLYVGDYYRADETALLNEEIMIYEVGDTESKGSFRNGERRHLWKHRTGIPGVSRYF